MAEKKCNKCAMTIPSEAKICPYCRKSQPGQYSLRNVAIAALILLTIAIIGGIHEEKTATNRSPEQKAADSLDYSIRYAAVEFLKQLLKAPATAKLPDLYELSVRPVENYRNRWIVTGQCDAENSYGAKLRHHFRFTIRKDKDGGMSLLESSFH